MQKRGILILILIISLVTSLNTEIIFSNAIDDEGFNSVAPNYDYRATGFNPQMQINKENVNEPKTPDKVFFGLILVNFFHLKIFPNTYPPTSEHTTRMIIHNKI